MSKGYYKYIEDIEKGRIVVCTYIKQAVERFKRLSSREDIYFDEETTDKAIEFVGHMKHYLGKCAGQSFQLLPWQQFFVAYIVGLKYKENGLRVVREVYLQMARKQGKTALIAALALYFMVADGEASPEIACLATSREQAHLAFDMICQFGKSLDPKETYLKQYRNYVKCDANNGSIKVFSSDSSKLDGLNIQLGIMDEFAALKDNLLYSVIKSSMGMRTQPMLICITTPQFSLSSPAYNTYQMSIEILSGVKEQDNFAPFLFTLDPDDEWDDENVWAKSNPSMGQTVTLDFIKGEVQNAKNDPTQEVPVKIKNIGIWTQSQSVWIPQEKVVKCMADIDFESYYGYPVYLGVDLSSVNDMTALSMMIPVENNQKYIFKTWAWIPEETFNIAQNKELYRTFLQDGSLETTPGNVVDYDAVTNKINEIAEHFAITGIYYDPWNSNQWVIGCTSLGYPMFPFSQSIGHYNGPTKEMAKAVLSQNCMMQKSRNVLWCFGNCVIKQDINGNQKCTKEEYIKKIDPVIAMTTALGGFLECNAPTDFEVFSI